MTYKEAIQDIRRRSLRYSNDSYYTRRVSPNKYTEERDHNNDLRNSKAEEIPDFSKKQEKVQNKNTTKSSGPIISFNIPAGTKVKVLNSVALYSDSDINLNAEILNGDGSNIIKYFTGLLAK